MTFYMFCDYDHESIRQYSRSRLKKKVNYDPLGRSSVVYFTINMRALKNVERQKAIPVLIIVHCSHQFWYPKILQMSTGPTINFYLSQNSKPRKENSVKYMFSEFWKNITDLQRLIMFSTLPSSIKGEKDLCFQRKIIFFYCLIILDMKLFLVYSALLKVLVYVFPGRSENLVSLRACFLIVQLVNL